LLLDHGTHITTLTVAAFELTASRAGRDCSWHTIDFFSTAASPEVAPSLLQFAYLPLRGVQAITNNMDRLNHVEVSLATSNQMPLAQLSSLLHQAATNLAACPAWQTQPISTITITGPLDESEQLLTALKPLGGPHAKELIIHPGSRAVDLGASIVEALANSLGNGVTKVELGDVTLSPAFWGTFAQCFPAVESLGLGRGVAGTDQCQLLLWCRTMHRPLTVSLHATNSLLHNGCNLLQQMIAALDSFRVPGVKFKVDDLTHLEEEDEWEAEEEGEDDDDDNDDDGDASD
jgi:hypothetical protein